MPQLAHSEETVITLSPNNAQVTFDVDSTWHTVHGTVGAVQGTLSTTSPANLATLHGDIHLGVKSFNTENARRDSRMLEVLAAEAFPEVVYHLEKIEGKCAIETLQVGQSCDDTALGELTIRDHTLAVPLALHIDKAEDGLTVTGESQLQWGDYGVEDPSILVAKLDKTVAVHLTVNLPPHLTLDLTAPQLNPSLMKNQAPS